MFFKDTFCVAQAYHYEYPKRGHEDRKGLSNFVLRKTWPTDRVGPRIKKPEMVSIRRKLQFSHHICKCLGESFDLRRQHTPTHTQLIGLKQYIDIVSWKITINEFPHCFLQEHRQADVGNICCRNYASKFQCNSCG